MLVVAALRYVRFLIAIGIGCVLILVALTTSTKKENSKAEEVYGRLEGKLRLESPELAGRLMQMREEHGEVAVAAVGQAVNEAKGDVGLVKLVSQPNLNTASWQMRLVSLAAAGTKNGDHQQATLKSHGVAIEALASADEELANAYLDNLELAAQDNELWLRVYDDPIAVQFLNDQRQSNTSGDDGLNLEIIDYYRANRDVLESVVRSVAAVPIVREDGSATRDDAADFRVVPSLAYQHRPHYLNAVNGFNGDSQSPAVLAATHFTFEDYGELIGHLVEKGVPVQEAVDVAFANGPYLDDHLLGGGVAPSTLAEELYRVRTVSLTVWDEARRGPLALDLHEAAPVVANDVLARFGKDDVASFLYVNFGDNRETLAAAAEALAGPEQTADLAFAVLAHYADDDRFRRLLINDAIGPRLILYAAIRGDNGLEELEEDPRYLNKYVALDGTPVDPAWWESLPGGALIAVTRNWKDGLPNEWSELGWAALDVADVALMVGSMGTSAAATQATKQGGKTVVKSVSRKAVKQGLRSSLSGRAKKMGARNSSVRATRKSLLSRLEDAGQYVRRQAAKTPGSKVAGSVIAASTNSLQTAGAATLQVVDAARKGWRAVPPKVKVWTYRGLLGASLFAELRYRTVPRLVEKWGELTDGIKSICDDVAASFANLLADALRDMFNIDLESEGMAGLFKRFLWGTLAVGCFLLAYIWRPWRKRLIYV